MSENIKEIICRKYKNRELTVIDFDKNERAIGDAELKRIKSIPQIAPFFENI